MRLVESGRSCAATKFILCIVFVIDDDDDDDHVVVVVVVVIVIVFQAQSVDCFCQSKL